MNLVTPSNNNLMNITDIVCSNESLSIIKANINLTAMLFFGLSTILQIIVFIM